MDHFLLKEWDISGTLVCILTVFGGVDSLPDGAFASSSVVRILMRKRMTFRRIQLIWNKSNEAIHKRLLRGHFNICWNRDT